MVSISAETPLEPEGEVYGQSLSRLDQAFITPLDREDILSLINEINGLVDRPRAAITIGLATIAKVPISTTHAIGGADPGVVAARGWHAVRWIWGPKIIVAWVLTLPGAAVIGAAGYAFADFAIQPFIH